MNQNHPASTEKPLSIYLAILIIPTLLIGWCGLNLHAKPIPDDELYKRLKQQAKSTNGLRGDIGKQGDAYWLSYMTDYDETKDKRIRTIMHILNNNDPGRVPTVAWQKAGIPVSRLFSFKTRQYDILNQVDVTQSEIVYGDKKIIEKAKMYDELIANVKPGCSCGGDKGKTDEKQEDIKAIKLQSKIYSILDEDRHAIDFRFTCEIREEKDGIYYEYARNRSHGGIASKCDFGYRCSWHGCTSTATS